MLFGMVQGGEGGENESSLAFLYLPWRLCNAYKMRLLDLCSTLTSGRSHITPALYSSCTAARQVPHNLKDRDADAPHSTRSMSVVSRQPGCIQHEDSQRRQLMSSQTRAAVVKRTRTHFGKRAFSACDPNIWNSFPPAVRNIDSHPSFRRALKSHLFYCAFIA